MIIAHFEGRILSPTLRRSCNSAPQPSLPLTCLHKQVENNLCKCTHIGFQYVSKTTGNHRSISLVLCRYRYQLNTKATPTTATTALANATTSATPSVVVPRGEAVARPPPENEAMPDLEPKPGRSFADGKGAMPDLDSVAGVSIAARKRAATAVAGVRGGGGAGKSGVVTSLKAGGSTGGKITPELRVHNSLRTVLMVRGTSVGKQQQLLRVATLSCRDFLLHLALPLACTPPKIRGGLIRSSRHAVAVSEPLLDRIRKMKINNNVFRVRILWIGVVVAV